MTLIKSISGIRGTIGGKQGDNLTPIDVVLFVSAFSQWLKTVSQKEIPTVVIGRDGRISGPMVMQLAVNTMIGCGVNVISVGLSTTPTVETYVKHAKADGGIILTASHNPKEWNALKLLNNEGEFISAEDGQQLLNMIDSGEFTYADVNHLGKFWEMENALDIHIQQICDDELVHPEKVAPKNYKVVIDGINSSGAFAIPALLEKLGVENYEVLNADITGNFAHNPEPLPENLTQLSERIKETDADLGIVVDPDVDRLALYDENGEPFGEEYTLVAVADYVLQNRKGNTVSNMSSSRALKIVTEKHGGEYAASAVGEVNVVNAMKANHAVIGGEGNGGVIYPPLHYGRDALAGVALFLSFLAQENVKVSELRNRYPKLKMVKSKIPLTPEMNVDEVLKNVEKAFQNKEVSTIDGVKVDFESGWVHLRKSNTEPIVRLYAEAPSQGEAERLAADVKQVIQS